MTALFPSYVTRSQRSLEEGSNMLKETLHYTGDSYLLITGINRAIYAGQKECANTSSQLLHFCPELPRLMLAIKDH